MLSRPAMKISATFLIAISSSLIAVTAADQGAPLSLGLAEGEQIALHANRDLISANDDVASALAGRLAAAEIQNPVLSVSTAKVGLRSTEGQTGPYRDRTYDSIISLAQLIELGGKRHKRILVAAAAIESAEWRRSDAERTLRLGVRQAMVAVATAHARRQASDEAAASIEREYAIAKERLRTGDIRELDADAVGAAAAQRRLDAITAAHDERAARQALGIVLGTDGEPDSKETLDTLTALSEGQLPSDPPLERPDIKAAEAALRSRVAAVQVASAGRIPDLTISVLAEHNPPGPPSNSVGIGVSLPLSIFNQNGAAISQAEADLLSARHALARVRAQAGSDLLAARNDSAAANDRSAQAIGVLLPQARKAWEATEFSFHRGAASNLDLLAAERALVDAQVAAIQAKMDALNARFALRALYDCSAIPDPQRTTP